MKILVFLADGFEEIEAISPIDIFKRAGIEVETVSINQTKEVNGAHGIVVKADKLFSEADYSNADLLFLPGGMPGTKNLDAHEGLKSRINDQLNANKPVAAICAAPSILGKMGLLNAKEAICYPGFENQLLGAKLSENKIAKAGLIYTAMGAGVALHFALKIVEDLKGLDESQKVAKAICL